MIFIVNFCCTCIINCIEQNGKIKRHASQTFYKGFCLFPFLGATMLSILDSRVEKCSKAMHKVNARPTVTVV